MIIRAPGHVFQGAIYDKVCWSLKHALKIGAIMKDLDGWHTKGTWKLPAEGLTPQKTQLAWLERKVHHGSGMFRHHINWKQEISNWAYMIINEGCKHSTATHPKESAWDMAAEPTLRSMKHNLGPLLWAVTIQPSELVCVYILEHLELRLYGWAKVVTTCQND